MSTGDDANTSGVIISNQEVEFYVDTNKQSYKQSEMSQCGYRKQKHSCKTA